MRRGLVLGGGGVLGAAWMVGKLCTLTQEELDSLEAIVGTSAGSVLATLLAAGVTPREMAAHQRGVSDEEMGRLAGVSYDYGVIGNRPEPPAFGIGSPSLLWQIVRRPGAFRTPALMAALIPRGRGSMGNLPEVVDDILPQWPESPVVSLCAMDFATGRRRVFGPHDPVVRPAVAVRASCAVPGWFEPVAVEGGLYVDGGSRSFNSVDVAAGRDLDEVIVLAPLAHSVRAAGPVTFGARMLRWWRLAETRRMYVEAELLRREGTRVRLITPTPDELAALGLNPMDNARRLRVLEAAMASGS